MNTRLIIALTLSLLMVVLYQLLFIKQRPKEIPPNKGWLPRRGRRYPLIHSHVYHLRGET